MHVVNRVLCSQTIDSCIRNELSRTKRIAAPIIEKLKERYEVETIVINELELDPVQYEENRRRGYQGVIEAWYDGYC